MEDIESYRLDFYWVSMATGLRSHIGGQAISWFNLNRDYREGGNIRGTLDALMESHSREIRNLLLGQFKLR